MYGFLPVTVRGLNSYIIVKWIGMLLAGKVVFAQSRMGGRMAEKILIVDDEKDIRCMLKDYFELQGYEIIQRLTGRKRWKK